MKILVLGGTRFFGKRLVERLLAKNHDITLFTRGRQTDLFNGIKHIHGDRSDKQALSATLVHGPFDAIYDQICFGPREAELVCQVFSGHTARYLFTSSAWVYPGGNPLQETAFNPAGYSTKSLEMADYAEGKRRAEAVFFNNSQLPTLCIRFPIVIGADDYTGRFSFHIERVSQGTPIVLPPPARQLNFINSQQAAEFLDWAKESDLSRGAINAACSDAYTPEEVVRMIAKTLNREARIITQGADVSPYHMQTDFVLDSSKAEQAGFHFTPMHEWLPEEVRLATKHHGIAL